MPLSIPVEVGLASPQSLINFYSVPDCDPTYNNVHRFGAKTIADQYFDKYKKVSIVQSKCTRYPDRVRIPFNADYIRQFNYMGFQNSDVYDVGTSAQNTGTPTYNGVYSPQGENEYSSFEVYCFINEVQWVNVHCCDVYYTVDVFSTYFPLAVMERSFVLRSHQYQDNNEKVGESFEPEPVSVNAYKIETEVLWGVNELCNAIVVEYNPKDTNGGFYLNGIYTVHKARAFLTSDVTGVNAFITEHTGEIYAVYQVPLSIVQNYVGRDFDIDSANAPYTEERLIKSCYIPHTAYTPKNKKCYQYPFCYSSITTPTGSSVVIKNEMFNDIPDPSGSYSNQTVTCIVNFALGDTTFSIIPVGYMGDTFSQYNSQFPAIQGHISVINPNIVATVGEFPQCTFDINQLTAYFANGNFQKSLYDGFTGILTSGIGGAMRGTANGGSPSGSGIIGSVLGAAEGALNIGGEIISNSFAPDNTGGKSTSTGSVTNGTFNVLANYFYPQLDELQHLDDFFEIFGYAINRLDRVDVMQRPFWCFYQVPDCNFHFEGGIAIPPYAVTEIKQAFARGITFWDRDKTFGDYTGDNHTS